MPNPNEEANRIAEQTFLPKTKNVLRLLDDFGYKNTYTYVLQFDMLTISLKHPITLLGYVFLIDLSSVATDQDIFLNMKARMGDA